MMDDTTETATPAETPEPVTPEAPAEGADETTPADDTTETATPVAPLINITLPRPMNVVLAGIRFRGGKAQARINPLQRLYLTRRAARFEEVPDETATPADEQPPADGDDASGDVETASTQEVPVPDETWTDEALDALGRERGITWRSNASKSTKVAKLTEN